MTASGGDDPLPFIERLISNDGSFGIHGPPLSGTFVRSASKRFFSPWSLPQPFTLMSMIDILSLKIFFCNIIGVELQDAKRAVRAHACTAMLHHAPPRHAKVRCKIGAKSERNQKYDSNINILYKRASGLVRGRS
jgi:hypothetical protein